MYPWIVGGDFNSILNVEEKSGGSMRRIGRCNIFKLWIEECKMHDMGFVGPKFT